MMLMKTNNTRNTIYTIIFFIVVFNCTAAYAALNDHFVTTWKTDNPGSSSDTSIKIVISGVNYGASFQVDWNGDGDFDDTDENITYTDDVVYDFLVAGTYQIRIKGTFNSIDLSYSDSDKLLSVDQWGTSQWRYFAFRGADNLVINASDVPDLSQSVSLFAAFEDAKSIGNGSGNWNWDTSTIVNMRFAFKNASAFNKDISSWTVNNVSNMNGMFEGATLFNQDISSWITSNVENMSSMFFQAAAFNQNISTWTTASVTDMSSMFFGATNFSQDIGGWTTSAVTSMRSMFASTSNFNQDLSLWDTSEVLDMSQMFAGSVFNENITTWTTSKVTDMSSMFSQNAVFNQNIGAWDTAMVEDMSMMFFEATAFNQDIGGWVTSAVLDMSQMFYDADAFNQDISTNLFLNTWSTAQVTNMSGMFVRNNIFNQDIGNWDTANVVDMSFMFSSATVFNQNIGSWNTVKVENMRSMFSGASAFNQNLSNWDTVAVTNMSFMFQSASDFDQNLGNWNVENVNQFNNMLIGATLSSVNYDALLIGWEALNLSQNEVFNAGFSKYCSQAAQTARNLITTNDNWSISDGGLCNQAPVITSSNAVNIDENETAVQTITVTDADDNSFNFSITGGLDGALFSINSSGLLQFNAAPDFESPGSSVGTNTYQVEVTVADSGAPVATDSQLITINVLDVSDTGGNLAPNIITNGGGTNAMVNVNENQFSVTTVLAIDPENGTISYSISGGADASKFSISAVSGILLFINAPDFEANGSNAGDNAYIVEVTATDDGTPNETDTQILTVNVIDVAEYTAADDFITTWKTDNSGVSNDSSILITTVFNGVSNYQVDWNNDGDFDDADENVFYFGDITHDFINAGTYQIRIRGEFVGLKFFLGNDKDKLMSIDQWGTYPIVAMNDVYSGASNLVINAQDTPNLTMVSNLNNTFNNAINLGNGTGNWDWDTSTMDSLNSTFEGASNFNQDISNWDTSNVQVFNNMFKDATVFNQDIGQWDTALASAMTGMFMNAVNFNQDISAWQIENVLGLASMFAGATLSTQNYDDLLIAWNLQTLNNGVNFHAGNSKYCSQAAQDARDNLVNINNTSWFITDGGITTSCLETIDLEVSITDNIDSALAGDVIVYTVIIRNIANGDVFDASVIDILPNEITATSWTCTPLTTSICTASGNGSINDMVDIPSGSRIIYTVNATITNSSFDNIQYSVNAQASLLQVDIDLSNNTATDINSNVDLIFSNGFE